MPNSNALLTSTLVASLVETEQPFAAPVVDGLSDDELISLQRLLAEVRRRADAAAASVAAAVAYRSRHELGHDGLAQRLGARTPQETALSIAAEIVGDRHGGTGAPLSTGVPIHRGVQHSAQHGVRHSIHGGVASPRPLTHSS